MTLKEAYIAQWVICQSKGLHCHTGGHYETSICFQGQPFYVSPDGKNVIRYRFRITGCEKTRFIKKNGIVIKKIHFHKDRLPVYGTITRQKKLKGFLYKYLLFLRCDGIEDKDLLKLYLLHCLTYKFEFWRKRKTIAQRLDGETVVEYRDWEKYKPAFEDVGKMIEGIIESAMKKQIDDGTREQFIVRSCCVVNPVGRDKYGAFWDKHKREKCSDAKKGQRQATDNKITAMYDPQLKDKENADRIGVSLRRIQEWKSDNRERLESIGDKIKRMYDPSLSLRKNALKIGCSINTLKKYREEPVERPAEPEETLESWIDGVLEEESARWDCASPPTKKRYDFDLEEMYELLDQI